jgi:hypothetical protein
LNGLKVTANTSGWGWAAGVPWTINLPSAFAAPRNVYLPNSINVGDSNVNLTGAKGIFCGSSGLFTNVSSLSSWCNNVGGSDTSPLGFMHRYDLYSQLDVDGGMAVIGKLAAPGTGSAPTCTTTGANQYFYKVTSSFGTCSGGKPTAGTEAGISAEFTTPANCQAPAPGVPINVNFRQPINGAPSVYGIYRSTTTGTEVGYDCIPALTTDANGMLQSAVTYLDTGTGPAPAQALPTVDFSGVLTASGGLVNGCKKTVTLAAGAGSWASGCLTSNVACWCKDTTTPANACTVSAPAANAVTLTGTGTDVIQLWCE